MAPVIFANSEGSGAGPRLNFVAIAILLLAVAGGLLVWRSTGDVIAPAAIVAAGLVLMQAPRVAQQWERAVVLRLGRFVGLGGPGLFWVLPVRARGELGGPDRVAGHHRPNDADRSSARARAHRSRAAAAHRFAVQSMGRD